MAENGNDAVHGGPGDGWPMMGPMMGTMLYRARLDEDVQLNATPVGPRCAYTLVRLELESNAALFGWSFLLGFC